VVILSLLATTILSDLLASSRITSSHDSHIDITIIGFLDIIDRPDFFYLKHCYGDCLLPQIIDLLSWAQLKWSISPDLIICRHEILYLVSMLVFFIKRIRWFPVVCCSCQISQKSASFMLKSVCSLGSVTNINIY
jgi:hypothetical protein